MLLQMALFHSFLWLSNILCVCVCVCVCLLTYKYIYTYISSSVDDHLDCFHVLDPISSASTNTENCL